MVELIYRQKLSERVLISKENISINFQFNTQRQPNLPVVGCPNGFNCYQFLRVNKNEKIDA